MHPRRGPRVLGELAADLRRAGRAALVELGWFADVADVVLFVCQGIHAIRGAVECLVRWSSFRLG